MFLVSITQKSENWVMETKNWKQSYGAHKWTSRYGSNHFWVMNYGNRVTSYGNWWSIQPLINLTPQSALSRFDPSTNHICNSKDHLEGFEYYNATMGWFILWFQALITSMRTCTNKNKLFCTHMLTRMEAWIFSLNSLRFLPLLAPQKQWRNQEFIFGRVIYSFFFWCMKCKIVIYNTS